MAKSVNNNKIYYFAGAIILGVVGYFGYNWYKKRKEAKDSGVGSTETNLGTGSTNTGVGAGSVSGSTSVPTTNPFKTQDEVLKFQQWVINTKKDKTILGTGGASGFGDDGKWGSKSGLAWDKYGKEYLTGSSSGTTEVYANLEKDITTIISNSSGQKAERSYLRATAIKYPDFVKNWAEAIRKRLSSSGRLGTTFVFANQVYDSYKADKVSEKLLIGKKAYKKDGNVYAFEEANRYSKNINLNASSKLRGEVKAYFFNKNQGILFLYIPNNNESTMRWYPLSSIEKFI